MNEGYCIKCARSLGIPQIDAAVKQMGFTDEDCKEDIAMRPYIILEDADGETVTLYGGILYRSIGYIAYQNRNAFAVGSAAYDYVWGIIHYVYGDQYDADYKG